MNSWTLTVEEDPETGDRIITFPPDLLETAGWKEGDTLKWIDLNNGSWQLEKIDKTVEKSV
jgi:hypothetical protein